jgi:DNA-binding NarL/FixJ family response regulator
VIFENHAQVTQGSRVFTGMSAAPRRPLGVLLVDDDPVFRELLAFVLRSHHGAEIVGQASDGAEGVELAAELRPEIVVMDLRMPRMDGFEATRRIAAKVQGTRVLIVSSSSEREDVERALAAGAAGYVPKDRAVAELPDELERLRTAIDRSTVLESTPMRPSLAALRLGGFLWRLVFGQPPLQHDA